MSRLPIFAHHAPVWNTYDCCCCCYGHFDCHSCVKVLVWIRVYRRSLKSKIFVSHSSCYHFVIWWWLLPLCVKVFCIHVKPWVWLRVSRQPEGGGGLLAAPLYCFKHCTIHISLDSYLSDLSNRKFDQIKQVTAILYQFPIVSNLTNPNLLVGIWHCLGMWNKSLYQWQTIAVFAFTAWKGQEP